VAGGRAVAITTAHNRSVFNHLQNPVPKQQQQQQK